MAIQKYHIGCTGWSLKAWKGQFFTDDATPGQFLSQYASVFNAVEGNTTFYNTPSAETVKKWGRQTPEGFTFCFKFPREITHGKRLHKVKDEVSPFLETFDPIADRLGPFLIQLPPSFSGREFSRLEKLLTDLPGAYRYGVEVRHQDYFDQGSQERRLNRLLKSLNIDRVIFDTRKLHAMNTDESSVVEAQQKKPKVPVRFITTGTHPVIRFIGSNDPAPNEPYLKEWAIIVADWIREGKRPYFFTHTPDVVSQPQIARSFHRFLSDLIDINAMPAWPFDRQSEQLDLF